MTATTMTMAGPLEFNFMMEEAERLSLSLSSLRKEESKTRRILSYLSHRVEETRPHVVHKNELAMREGEMIAKLSPLFENIQRAMQQAIAQLEAEYMQAMDVLMDHTRTIQKKRNLMAMCETLLHSLSTQESPEELGNKLHKSVEVFDAFPLHLRDNVFSRSSSTELPASSPLSRRDLQSSSASFSTAPKPTECLMAVTRTQPFQLQETSPQVKQFLSHLLPPLSAPRKSEKKTLHTVQLTTSLETAEFILQHCSTSANEGEDKTLALLLTGYFIASRNIHVSLLLSAPSHKFPEYLRSFYVARFPEHCAALKQSLVQHRRNAEAFVKQVASVFTEKSHRVTRPQEIVHGDEIDMLIPPLRLLSPEAADWFKHNNTLTGQPKRVAAPNIQGTCETCHKSSLFFSYKHCGCRTELRHCFGCAVREYFSAVDQYTSNEELTEQALPLATCARCKHSWALESLLYVACERTWFFNNTTAITSE